MTFLAHVAHPHPLQDVIYVCFMAVMQLVVVRMVWKTLSLNVPPWLRGMAASLALMVVMVALSAGCIVGLGELDLHATLGDLAWQVSVLGIPVIFGVVIGWVLAAPRPNPADALGEPFSSSTHADDPP